MQVIPQPLPSVNLLGLQTWLPVRQWQKEPPASNDQRQHQTRHAPQCQQVAVPHPLLCREVFLPESGSDAIFFCCGVDALGGFGAVGKGVVGGDLFESEGIEVAYEF